MANIDWKARLTNKACVTGLAGATIAFVYQVLGCLGVVPAISSETVVQYAGLVINLLVALGVIVNPTTDGISD